MKGFTFEMILLSRASWRKDTLFDVDNTLATALIDRLMHHGEAIVIQGDNYRMKDKSSDSTSA
jgi:DNA replication protein DnaC